MLSDIIRRIRRNHALEHATIHMLSEGETRFAAQGNATHNGFYLNLFGDLSVEDVEAAARQAHARMASGEHQLALHPNCGTVLLTTATVATLAAQSVFAVEQKRLKLSRLSGMAFWNVFPTAVLAVVLSLIISRPLGMYLQTFTTDGVMGEMRIKQVKKISPSPVTHFFRVLLGQNKRGNVNAYFIETEG